MTLPCPFLVSSVGVFPCLFWVLLDYTLALPHPFLTSAFVFPPIHLMFWTLGSLPCLILSQILGSVSCLFFFVLHFAYAHNNDNETLFSTSFFLKSI